MYLHLLELLHDVVEPKSFLQFYSMISLVALHVATKLNGEEKEGRREKDLEKKGVGLLEVLLDFLISVSASWRCF